ncbi:MAG: methyltransferase domain-containing protein [Nibricoccus sp.]
MRFNQKASVYEKSATIQATLADWVAEWIEPHWPATTRALEFGAGTGLLTRRLENRGQLTATDLSPEMLRIGRERLPKVRWEIANAWNPSMAPVDRIFSSAMLQWAPEPQRVLKSWLPLIIPGGRMVHGLFVTPTLPELSAITKRLELVQWHSTETWIGMLQRAGFSVFRWETKTIKQHHAGTREFLRQLHDTGATSRTPQLRIGELRSLMAEFDRRYAGPDGTVEVTWTLMRVECRRN